MKFLSRHYNKRSEGSFSKRNVNAILTDLIDIQTEVSCVSKRQQSVSIVLGNPNHDYLQVILYNLEMHSVDDIFVERIACDNRDSFESDIINLYSESEYYFYLVEFKL